MKTINLACVLAVLGACAVDEASDALVLADDAQAATQADVWNSTWNGGSASAQFSSATGGGYLDVYEHKTKDFRYAYVNLSAWSFDPTSLQCFTYDDPWYGTWEYCYFTRSTYTYGWGQIPESDARMNGNAAHVKTTFGPSFYGYQCTWDSNNWMSSGCLPLTGASIDVRWHKDGVFSTFQSGTNQQQYGGYTYKSQGTYRSASARASGTIVGQSYEGAWGSFGDTRGVNVSKSITRTN